MLFRCIPKNYVYLIEIFTYLKYICPNVSLEEDLQGMVLNWREVIFDENKTEEP